MSETQSLSSRSLQSRKTHTFSPNMSLPIRNNFSLAVEVSVVKDIACAVGEAKVLSSGKENKRRQKMKKCYK